MKKTLIASIIGLSLFSNVTFAEKTPDFLENTYATLSQETHMANDQTYFKFIPNDKKWKFLFTNEDNIDYWINESSIIALNGDSQRVKFEYCIANNVTGNHYYYATYKSVIDYTDEYFMQLTGNIYDANDGKQIYNSTESQQYGSHYNMIETSHWFGTLVKKQPINKSSDIQILADTLKPYLTNTNKVNGSNYSNNSTNILQQTSVIPGNAYLPERTKINVELLDRLDSKKSTRNQVVSFKTTENLIINEVVVIPAGTIGKGLIYDIQKPGGFGRKGVVRMAAKEIKTLNNVTVPLIGGLGGQGKSDGGAVAVAAVVSLAGGFFMKGSGVVFEPGTNFTVEIKQDTDLGVTFDGLKDAMNPSRPRGVHINLPTR